MITIAVDPVLAYLGPISLRWYGLTVAAAVAVAILIALREGRRRGVPEDDVYSLSFWALLSGIATARLLYVAGDWDNYRYSLRSVVAFQPGGLVLFGGLAGGVLAGIIYCRLRELQSGRIGDVAAPALLLAHAVGRIGAIINGNTWGAPTYLPWGLVYTNPGALVPSQLLGIPTHPIPAYEIIWDFVVFGLLWRMRSRPWREGSIFLAGLFLYSAGQFLVAFLRRDEIAFAGLQQPQLLAAAAALLALMLLQRLWRGTPYTHVGGRKAEPDTTSPPTVQ
ncbi:MAG: prolipoprotein diacylglyceryl transferase [Actinobacteria bacterium]|nr:prolipoprotein diacylglyceryl transferase [Actinomycetota bacterium]MCL5025222.1 prolipoprotein diacylglyceryl transferase [Chloroflexota bacterium]